MPWTPSSCGLNDGTGSRRAGSRSPKSIGVLVRDKQPMSRVVHELPASFLVKDLDESDKADFRQRERSLLYLSATRARDELVIMLAGGPSEMLPLEGRDHE